MRVFLIVLDSFGIGEEPDAPEFGDYGVNTLRSVSGSVKFDCPNLKKLGLFNIEGVGCGEETAEPAASFARLREVSRGKDTTVGHWELAGVPSLRPLPTYPDGFPEEVVRAFEEKTGRRVLCNMPYSGTDVIRDYGEEQMKTGALIVYTSADSVFQVAANEAVVPVEQLYEYCRIARELLTGEHGVGRVIARPFAGTSKENFERTPRRHDFSLKPPKKTMLDFISGAGMDVIAVGKINDIFAGSGVTRAVKTSGNTEGIRATLDLLDEDFSGLAFINLVDFDMLYGHRRDIDGYAAAMTEFDRGLEKLLPKLRPDDLLMITADHGCDPAYTRTTDHTREYVPLLVCGGGIRAGADLGTRTGFGAVGATVCGYLGVEAELAGESLLAELRR